MKTCNRFTVLRVKVQESDAHSKTAFTLQLNVPIFVAESNHGVSNNAEEAAHRASVPHGNRLVSGASDEDVGAGQELYGVHRLRVAAHRVSTSDAACSSTTPTGVTDKLSTRATFSRAHTSAKAADVAKLLSLSHHRKCCSLIG